MQVGDERSPFMLNDTHWNGLRVSEPPSHLVHGDPSMLRNNSWRHQIPFQFGKINVSSPSLTDRSTLSDSSLTASREGSISILPPNLPSGQTTVDGIFCNLSGTREFPPSLDVYVPHRHGKKGMSKKASGLFLCACGTSCSTRSTLKRHQKTVHTNEPYYCPNRYCRSNNDNYKPSGAGFSRKFSFLRHIGREGPNGMCYRAFSIVRNPELCKRNPLN